MSPIVLPHKTLTLSLLGIALMLSACGGSTSEDSGFTVVSSDGMATLVIAEGSLPDGVSIGDIQIDWAEGLSDEPGAPISAVRLSPSGLNLSEPATLQVDIPETTGLLFGVHSSADGFEFVDVEVQFADDKRVAAIEIDHFSVVTLYVHLAVDATSEATPAPLMVGETQSVYMNIDMADTPFLVWIFVDNDRNELQYQLVIFQVESIAKSEKFPMQVSWLDPQTSRISSRWSPGEISDTEKIVGLSVTMSASSECTDPNKDNVRVEASLTATLSVVSTGSVVDGSTLGLLEAFDSRASIAKPLGFRSDPDSLPYGVEQKATTHAPFTFITSHAATCVGESGSVTPPTPPPEEKDPTILHLFGVAGDGFCEDSSNTLDPALDITGLDIVQDGDVMVATITYVGDAEAYHAASFAKFPFSLQFRLKEDTSGYPEVFFAEKGRLKVSGGLLQVVSYEFSGNKLIIRIKGRTLEEVHSVQTSTFTFDGGLCKDLINSPGYDS